MKHVVVIGAGFGGLSAACYLAQAGHRVTLVEKNETPGGRAMVWRKDGFTFDMGPSWYLMPDIFNRFFAHFGKLPSDYYTLKRLDPSYRIFFGENDVVDMSANLEANLDLFESMEKGAKEKMKSYLHAAEYEYKVAVDKFLYRDYSSLLDFADPTLAMEGLKLHIFENFDSYTKRFFKNDRLRKILEYTIVFLGGAPSKTPALYSLMSHVDFNLGVWYPEGGMGNVIRGIETLAKGLGVTLRYQCPVKSIDTHAGMVKGVTLESGEVLPCDIVISGADYHHTEIDLLEKHERTYDYDYWSKRTMAPSAFILYLGLGKKIPALSHHNLFLDHDWQRHFNDIFERPAWPEYPSYYVSCPSVTDPTVAPEGKENVFILVPVASGLQDDDATRNEYRDKVIKGFSSLTGVDIGSLIEVERMFTHRDFSEVFNAYQGTALGLSHTLMQTALFRPARTSKKVRGLYYTGQYTHPGIGMPMTLISSHITCARIQNDIKPS